MKAKNKLNRIINPAIIKMFAVKCKSNCNQMAQWTSIQKIANAINVTFPGLMEVGENEQQIRFVFDAKAIKKPSVWKRLKFLFTCKI